MANITKTLQIRYKNINFKNPFILASAPPTRNGEMISRAFEQGWAGAVTKTICFNHRDIVHTSPRFFGLGKGDEGLKKIGLKNIELISETSPEKWSEDIQTLKKNYPENIIIASIAAEADNPDSWAKLSLMMQKSGADIIELNLSCPHGLPEKGMGSACCDVPEFVAEIVKSVKNHIYIPVWVKLSPNVSNISFLAHLAIVSGADGITAINTLGGFAGIDIETLSPNLNIAQKSSYGGISGSLIKPVALKCVSDIYNYEKFNAKKCFISSAGGIYDWKDAVEFMLFGASTVQICTKVMFEGFGVINGLVSGMEDYLKRHGCHSAMELVGKASNSIVAYESLDKKAKMIPKTDFSRCTKCLGCFISCRDSGYQAIEKDSGGFPKTDYSKCTGCGLCAIVCPVGCIENCAENMYKII